MNLHVDRVFDSRPSVDAAHFSGLDEGPLVILAGALAAARRRVVPLGIWVLLCLAAAAWYLHVTPPSYTASATVILDPKRLVPPIGDSVASAMPPVLDSAAAESQIQVIRSERLLSSVFAALDLADAPSLRPDPPDLRDRIVDGLARLFRAPRAGGSGEAENAAAAYDAFAGRVGARRIGQSYVVEVSYTSGDPDEARRLANAVVSAYLGQQVSYKLAAAQNGAEYLQGRITALANEVKVATAGMMAGTVPATLLPDAEARVIGAALEPLGRSAPKTGLVVGFAASFGVLSGLFAVSVLNGLDRRVRSSDQLERATGLPCLGTIPDVRRRQGLVRRSFTDLARVARRERDGRFAAAVRNTRTSILLALGGERGHAVGVASWSEGAGRSLVAANLAQVVAMSGAHVTLVDADINRADGGLSVLAGPVSVGLAECLLDPTGSTRADTTRLDENLSLVTARSSEGGRGFDAYLGAPGLARLVEIWRDQGDVIVDLPALASGGDARAAATHLDGVVIVVEGGRTTADDVKHAISALSHAGAIVVGTILHGARA